MDTSKLKTFFRIIYSAAGRFYMDDGFSRAAALAYSSLLALVPLTSITVQLLSSVNIGHMQAMEAIRGILERVLPPGQNKLALELQNQIFSVLEGLGSNVKDLNTLTILTLIVTSAALFNTIQSAIDYVWRVGSSSSILNKIVTHWTVFTAWLLLIVMTALWSGNFGGFSLDYNLFGLEHWLNPAFLLPSIFTWLTLGILYAKVPATNVRYKDAFFGAFIAAILFEFLKRGFAYYLGKSSAYSALYGILASIPLFLFWLYLIWVVVLFGAHISYQSGSIKYLHSLRKYATELGEVGSILGLRILKIISQNFIEGNNPPTEGELAVATGSNPVIVRRSLDILTDAEVLTLPHQDKHYRTLRKSPRNLLVKDILKIFTVDTGFWNKEEPASDQTNEDVKEDFNNETLDMICLVSKKSKKKVLNLTLEEFVEISSGKSDNLKAK